MATTTTGRTQCVTCGKERTTSRCEGCLQNFCYNHLGEHRQQLSQQLDEIEVNRDEFRQTLTQQTTESQKHPLIEKINQWEEDSIQKIKQTAEEARQLILERTAMKNHQIEEKLNKLTNQLKQGREENDINEIDLQKWKEELTEFTEQSAKPSGVAVRQSSIPLITSIIVDTFAHLNSSNIPTNAKWIQNAITVAAGNGQGNGLNQLSLPYGIYIDDEQTIYVADYSNHRIVEWKNGATSGQIVAGGNGAGNRNDQLNGPQNVIIDKESDSLIISDRNNNRVVRWPRRNGTSGETIISSINCFGLAMDNNRYVYVSDVNKCEVRRWKIGERNGVVVAGGNGVGNRLDQLNNPYYIFVNQDYSVYVSDMSNNRVMKWTKGAKEGIVVAGGQGQGNNLTQFSGPYGIIIDQQDTVYVADYSNHRVIRWLKGATQGSVIVGGNGQGGQANKFNYPVDLSFDRENNLYVVDIHNHRVQKFHIEQNSNR